MFHKIMFILAIKNTKDTISFGATWPTMDPNASAVCCQKVAGSASRTRLRPKIRTNCKVIILAFSSNFD